MTEENNCKELLARILSFIDGDMEGPGCDDLKSHLDGCSDCAACLEIIMKTISLCGGKIAMPDGAREGLAQSIRRELEKKDGSS